MKKCLICDKYRLIYFKSDQFRNAETFDFTGINSLTDYHFYKIGQHLAKLPDLKLIDFDKIRIRGVQFVSIWALHYLYQAVNQSIFDLKKSKLQVI